MVHITGRAHTNLERIIEKSTHLSPYLFFGWNTTLITQIDDLIIQGNSALLIQRPNYYRDDTFCYWISDEPSIEIIEQIEPDSNQLHFLGINEIQREILKNIQLEHSSEISEAPRIHIEHESRMQCYYTDNDTLQLVPISSDLNPTHNDIENVKKSTRRHLRRCINQGFSFEYYTKREYTDAKNLIARWGLKMRRKLGTTGKTLKIRTETQFRESLHRTSGVEIYTVKLEQNVMGISVVSILGKRAILDFIAYDQNHQSVGRYLDFCTLLDLRKKGIKRVEWGAAITHAKDQHALCSLNNYKESMGCKTYTTYDITCRT
jgi:hypothetical protein